MKKIVSLSLALLMLFALIPTAISASAEELTIEPKLDCYATSGMTWNGTQFTGTMTNDQAIVFGFDSSVFDKYNVTKITYSFTAEQNDGSEGRISSNKCFCFWGPRGIAKVNSTTAADVTKLGALSAFQWFKYDATNGVKYYDGKTDVYPGDTYTVTDEQLATIKEKGYTYFYIPYGNTSAVNNLWTATKVIPKVTLTYTTSEEPESPVGDVTMADGAAMRLNKVTGIRYYTNVDSAKIESAMADGYEVEMGTLIAPADKIGENGLTFEDMDAANYLDVKYTAKDEDGKFVYFEEDGFAGIVGSIANIKDSNANRKFVGRGYVKYTKDGVTETVYADYSNGDVANNTRTISGIATTVKANSTYFDSLTEAQQATVNYWAEKAE